MTHTPNDIPVHPVQNHYRPGIRPQCPQVVTMKAYEVYCALWGEQEALVTGECRGGFGVGELIALLYAHSFPKTEWRARFDEAVKGMQL